MYIEADFNASCPGDCYSDFVLGNGSVFNNAYFEVQSIRVFSNPNVAPASANSSSSAGVSASAGAASSSQTGTSTTSAAVVSNHINLMVLVLASFALLPILA
jgi:hypothetical protein